MSTERDYIILGGGITGLSIAHWLKKAGKKVLVLEKNKQAGGVIRSHQADGFTFDYGANSTLSAADDDLRQLVTELRLTNKMLTADAKANKRYILKNGKLHPIQPNPKALLSTKLFSTSAKLRLLKEPFIKPHKGQSEESVADFVRRRMGDEILDYAFNPMIAGIYAGNPERLSLKSVFPDLYEMEQQYGSLFKAMREKRKVQKTGGTPEVKKEMLSFQGGMQQLPLTLSEQLGDSLLCGTTVMALEKTESGYLVHTDNGRFNAPALVCTLPAYQSASLFKRFHEEAHKRLERVEYAPVLVVHLAYEKEAIQRELDSFGFLIPEKERHSFLGAIWSSTIFPANAPEDKATFTLFVGGARQSEISPTNAATFARRAKEEFEPLMGISAKAVYEHYHFWEKAIPQYNLGHHLMENALQEMEAKHQGLYIAGNFRGGISVAQCVKNAKALTDKLLSK